jgi:hypothetical protein
MNGSIIAVSRRGTAIDLTQGRLMFLVDTMGEPMFQFHPYQVQLLVPARTAVDMALNATVSRGRPRVNAKALSGHVRHHGAERTRH